MVQKNSTRRTDINKNTVNLDNYTMMNATYAKQPFTDKTICEVLAYIALHVNVQLDYTIPYASEWHKYDNHCQAIGKGFTENTTTNYVPIIVF